MTQLCSKEWAAKARKRKAYRDHYRDKFFTENGVSKGAIPSNQSGAPAKQRLRILKLMKLTKSGGALSADQEAMMVGLARQMLIVGLGKGIMGQVSESIQDMNTFSFSELKKFF